MISYCTTLFMRWHFLARIPRPWRSSKSGLRAMPDAENFGLSLASDTEAFAGHLGKARELTKRSVESAIRADSKESGAIWQENAAVREAAYGNAIGSEAGCRRRLKT